MKGEEVSQWVESISMSIEAMKESELYDFQMYYSRQIDESELMLGVIRDELERRHPDGVRY